MDNGVGIFTDFLITLLGGIVVFLFGLSWPKIPKSYRQFHLCRFWGKGVLSDDFVVSYAAFLDSRHKEGYPHEFWYMKHYRDDREAQFVGPRGQVAAIAEIRSASYFINTLSKYRKKAVPLSDDWATFDNLNRTFVSIGSSTTNETTGLIIRQQNNKFLEFDQKGRTFIILDKKTNKEFKGDFQGSVKKDHGMILKIPNQRYPGHFFFVCAGLGEWGTSGASWYLATNWRDLQKEFGNKAFGIVVEVECGTDESAQRIFTCTDSSAPSTGSEKDISPDQM